MSRRPVSIWIHERLERARWLTLGGAIGLIPLSMLAASVTWWMVYVMLYRGLGFLLELSHAQISSICWAFLGTVYVWHFLAGCRFTEEYSFNGPPHTFADRMMMRMSSRGHAAAFVADPSMAISAATYLTAWFLLSPQLLALSIAMFRRTLALKRLDDQTAERVLATMMKGQSRLPLTELRERFQPASETELIGGLTALDGVVLIGAETDSPALTVAPRLNEDYKDWLAARRERQAAL